MGVFDHASQFQLHDSIQGVDCSVSVLVLHGVFPKMLKNGLGFAGWVFDVGEVCASRQGHGHFEFIAHEPNHLGHAHGAMA